MAVVLFVSRARHPDAVGAAGTQQVAVDTEFHQTMFDLHQSVNKKEVIVGWYATGTR
jgi:hypothetical protein